MSEDRYDVIKSARLLAMQAVKTDLVDPQYFFRLVFRWYSKTFSTPLHIVEELPLEDVLQHYFESKYETLEPLELEEELKAILETAAERKEREQKEAEEEMSDEQFLEELRKEAAEKKQLGKGLVELPNNKAVNPDVLAKPEPKTMLQPDKLDSVDIKFDDDIFNKLDDLDPFDLISPSKK